MMKVDDQVIELSNKIADYKPKNIMLVSKKENTKTARGA